MLLLMLTAIHDLQQQEKWEVDRRGHAARRTQRKSSLDTIVTLQELVVDTITAQRATSTTAAASTDNTINKMAATTALATAAAGQTMGGDDQCTDMEADDSDMGKHTRSRMKARHRQAAR